MNLTEVESIIHANLDAIAALDYSDVAYMDDFIETAWSPVVSVHGVSAHIERTRHVGMSHLPVNYVIVTELDGKDTDYTPTITVDGNEVGVTWQASKRTPALQSYLNAVKAHAVEILVKAK